MGRWWWTWCLSQSRFLFGDREAEVGTATAMAAAGLMAVLNGTPRQVDPPLKMLMSYSVLLCRSVKKWQVAAAATSALEHSLGMTCDPVPFLHMWKNFWTKISDFRDFRSWAWCRRHASSAIPWVPPRRQKKTFLWQRAPYVFFTVSKCVACGFFFSVRLVLSGCRIQIQITVTTVLLQPNSLMMSMSLL